jgi:hypothetical protein
MPSFISKRKRIGEHTAPVTIQAQQKEIPFITPSRVLRHVSITLLDFISHIYFFGKRSVSIVKKCLLGKETRNDSHKSLTCGSVIIYGNFQLLLRLEVLNYVGCNYTEPCGSLIAVLFGT